MYNFFVYLLLVATVISFLIIKFKKEIKLIVIKFVSSFLKVSLIIIVLNSILNFFLTDFFWKSPEKMNLKESKLLGANDQKFNVSWRDYDYNFYEGIIKINTNDVYNSIKNKERKWNAGFSSWGDFYHDLYIYDKSRLDLFYPMLDKIWNTKSLTRREFLDVIMSFTQGIEYNIPILESCSNAYKYDSTVRDMINNGIECDSYVKGAIYSPVEFIDKFKGDCDTRTVFLYTVLKRYKYDVVILNSDVYGHSILGVNISSSGRYKYHNGKRYYTWETTYPGWRLGTLPPSTNNIKYWHVTL